MQLTGRRLAMNIAQLAETVEYSDYTSAEG